jgi:lipopolysaccharide transport system ATP-binding protein
MFVDEILAVGDAAFQQKCLGKMKDAVTKGRTVLFVSHNMAAVLNLCPRSIWLRGGEIAADGPTDEVVNRYLHSLNELKGQRIAEREDRRGNQAMRFVDFELRNAEGERVRGVQSGEPATFALRYETDRDNLCNVYAAIAVHGAFDENLFDMNTDLNGFRFKSLPREGTLLCTVPSVPLRPGSYSFNVYCSVSGELADWVLNAGTIEVDPGDFFGSGKLPPADQGAFLVRHTWRLDGEATLARSCGQASQ